MKRLRFAALRALLRWFAKRDGCTPHDTLRATAHLLRVLENHDQGND